MNLEALAKLATEATPGPWRWYGQIGRHIMLTTVGRGIVTVMGAKRLGMQGAESTFGVRRAEDRGKWGIGGVMTGASKLAIREVRYRDDIVGIDHPDAAYIAAASPDVVLALVRVAQAADFRASVKFDKGWHGADLLDGIAAWMDRKDDDRDMASGATSSDRTVQADVRRWATELRAALADLDR